MSLVKRFPSCYGTRITVFNEPTTFRYPEPDNTVTQPHRAYVRSVLIRSSYLKLIPKDLHLPVEEARLNEMKCQTSEQTPCTVGPIHNSSSRTNFKYDITSLMETGKWSDTLPNPSNQIIGNKPSLPLPYSTKQSTLVSSLATCRGGLILM